MGEPEPHTHKRLTNVESEQSKQGAQLARQGASIDALASVVQSVGRKMDQLLDSRSDRPWGPMATWAGVLLLIGAMAFTPVYRDLERVREDSSVSDRELDIILQREMRLLDSRVQEQITRLRGATDKLEIWIQARDADSQSSQAQQAQQIRALEREAFGGG